MNKGGRLDHLNVYNKSFLWSEAECLQKGLNKNPKVGISGDIDVSMISMVSSSLQKTLSIGGLTP